MRWQVSLSYFENNIYFWDFSNVEKCLRKLKMDKKNVQFLKTRGFLGNMIFQKCILDQNAANSNFFIQKVLP
uniref:Uncharacterized protein n=1 Tax=viral metagenome TaxID=1070528 RepID=A0A6C0HQH8_9ZZZZ